MTQFRQDPRLDESAAGRHIVTTQSGKLRGVSANGAHSFKGIPYGADTSGTNRFLQAKPAAPWTGIREAVAIGPRCPQTGERHPPPFDSYYWSEEPMSEDCLVLNIYTPSLDANAKLAVMVYLHGGAYANGSSGSPAVEGSNLAKRGNVVVVTLNHRLNLFGFTHFGEMDGGRFIDAGNNGMLDILVALQWVRDNIAQFGGDPSRVTTFGHSGGGSKSSLLMGMPSAKGLFHRSINMAGGSAFGIAGAEEGAASALGLIAALGLKPGNLAPLADFSFAQLLAARKVAMGRTKRDGFRPVVDQRTFFQQVYEPELPSFSAQVPFMLGTGDTELAFHLGRDLRNYRLSEAQAQARIGEQFGYSEEQTRKVMQAYRDAEPGRTPSDILIAIGTDHFYRLPMIGGADRKAEQHAQGGAPAYMYVVGWHAPGGGGIYKAPHTMAVPLAFGNYEVAAPLLGSGPEPKAVSDAMLAAFTAFAKTGDPNHPGIPRWEPYTKTQRTALVFDSPSRSEDHYRSADLRAATLFPVSYEVGNERTITAYKD